MKPLSFGSRLGVALALLGGLCGLASAQQVYRIVGPDGRVTFSDQPPPTTSNAKVTSGPAASGGVGGGALPYVLQQTISRYPVTLYTSSDCGPCVTGRGMLMQRGVPFTEKTVTTPEDLEALKRLSGNNSLPFLTIGAQQIRGFSDLEWTQFLDAAGYPKTSQLPGGYRNPPATALVNAQRPDPNRPQTASDEQANARTPSAPATPGPAVENPAGIRF